MTEKVKKSNEVSETLKARIVELGKDGLKKALDTLSEEDMVTLCDTLKELTKAVEMDDAYVAEKVLSPEHEAASEISPGNDDEDEKLVKPEAAQHKHQGDDTPKGKEGQVIKACKKAEKEEKVEMKVEKPVIAEVESEEELKKKAPKGVDPKKHESCVKEVKKQGKDIDSAHSICTSSMKKEEKVKKSVVWEDDNKLLKANILGRNYHYNVNKYYDECLESVKKSESNTEELKKAESEKKSDINDMIEKGQDVDYCTIANRDVKVEGNIKVVQSFKDEDFDALFPATEEEDQE